MHVYFDVDQDLRLLLFDIVYSILNANYGNERNGLIEIGLVNLYITGKMKLKGGIFMKNMKGLVIGIVIGVMLTVSANAAVSEYTLKQSECKLVVDGQVVQDEKLPVLLMEPGYNYIPAAAFRNVCGEIGVGFAYDSTTKEIQLTTTQTVATKSIPVKAAPTVSPTPVPVEYKEPATIERDGVKKALMTDIYKMLKPLGYIIEDSGKSDYTLYLYDPSDNLIQTIPFSMHQYNNQGVAFIDYRYFVDNLKPLIK